MIIAIFIVLIGCTGFIIPVGATPIDGESSTTFHESSVGNIVIKAKLPEVPASIPIYRATVRNGDVLYMRFGNTMSPKHNVTSEQDAPEVAKRVMEQYGGLPSDAVFVWSETSYLETQTDTGEVLYKEPVTTSVAYGRMINGLSLDGDTDYIRLELGENGEPLEIRKIWRTISFTGNASIIPASKAVKKIGQGESIDTEWLPDHVNVFIDTAVLRYYEKGQGDTSLEPVWVFVGSVKPGDFVTKYIVNARQFANFTTTPQIASISTNITFTDTSDTTAIKWYWEFGDGTNSTLRNPTHAYMSEGNYTVNLTMWNEYGSDIISRENCIKILPNYSPIRQSAMINSAGKSDQRNKG